MSQNAFKALVTSKENHKTEIIDQTRLGSQNTIYLCSPLNLTGQVLWSALGFGFGEGAKCSKWGYNKSFRNLSQPRPRSLQSSGGGLIPGPTVRSGFCLVRCLLTAGRWGKPMFPEAKAERVEFQWFWGGTPGNRKISKSQLTGVERARGLF